MKNKIIIATILTLFVIAFYLQDQYAIASIDDWTYAFIVQENYSNFQSAADDNVYRQPVASLYDALVSQSRDYFKTNGRFIVHTLVQYICGTKSMSQYVILNTIVFGVFTLFILLLTRALENIWNVIFSLSAIWIVLPHKGLTFMGNITCSIDYLWACTASLIFIYLFEKLTVSKRFTTPVFLLFTTFSFVAGSLQESFTIGIAGTLVLYVVWKNKMINKQVNVVTIAYVLGTCTCLFTPANFRRFDDIGGAGFHFNIILGLLSSPPFIIMILTCIVLIRKKMFCKQLQQHFIIFMPIIISLMFAVFIAYNGRHQLTAINVFSLIILIRLWKSYHQQRLKHSVTIALTILALLSYYPILKERKSYHDAYMSIIVRAEQSSNRIIDGKEFEEKGIIIKHNPFLECNYIWPFTFQDWDFFERSLSIYLTQGKNNNFIQEVTK